MNKETVDLVDFAAKAAFGLLVTGAGHAVQKGVHKALTGEAIRKEPLDLNAFKKAAQLTEDILRLWGTTTETVVEDQVDHELSTVFVSDEVAYFPGVKVVLTRFEYYVPPEDRDEDYEPDKPSYWITIITKKGQGFIQIRLPSNLDEIRDPKDLERTLYLNDVKTRIRPRRLEMPDVRRAISILESVRAHPKPKSLS